MLTQLERQLLRYEGMPAREVARVLGSTTQQVLDGWAKLKRCGVMRSGPAYQGPAQEQLSFGDFDRLMRGNRAPTELPNHEIGWTTDTDSSW